jgi:hypothetical protein
VAYYSKKDFSVLRLIPKKTEYSAHYINSR